MTMHSVAVLSNSMKLAFPSYFIGDAALYAAEMIQSLDEQGQLFISRAPQKLKLVKDAISEQNNYNFTALGNGYSVTWINSNYGDVKQRWLLVFSEQAKKRELHTLDKRMLKDATAALKSLEKLSKQRFAFHADAMKMRGIWMKSQASMSMSDIGVIEYPILTKSGRPKTGQVPDGYEYQVTSLLASKLNFRERKLSEKGFRSLKSSYFLTLSLYLKKAERVEAFVCNAFITSRYGH
ncbi:MAG: transposase [Moritella dasanensis]|jgi:transposase